MPNHAVMTGLAFTIVVDSEHWVPLTGGEQTLARTEYLLVDARTPTWTMCSDQWRLSEAKTNPARDVIDVAARWSGSEVRAGEEA